MRTSLYGLFVFVPLVLAAISFGGCGDGDGGDGSTSSSSSSSSSGSGGGDPCAGHACGDACTTCPPGAPCMPMACDASGACVDEAMAVCSMCPDAEPAEGSACPKVGLVCDLDDGPIIVCRARTQCSDTGWKNLAPGCTSSLPNDPTCPAAEPSGACDVAKDPGLCGIGDALCGCTNCVAGPCGGPGEWVCAKPPAAPCPVTAPKLGAVCADEGAKCVYGACSLGGTAVGRDCFGGIWTEQIVNCPK